MSTHNFKFGKLDNSSQEIPYEYPDRWAFQQTTGPSRLIIGPAVGHIGLLRDLIGVMEEPFGLLFVLVVPRSGEEPGRYQSPLPTSKQDALAFLNRFERFLESDGRHNLWVKSMGTSDLLVYDRHNLIYAYGGLDQFKKILATKAIAEAPEIMVPVPHIHYYHEANDEDCRQLLEYWHWERSPLHEQDEK